MRVVATAGHVDHGKSSLVLALTGTDPDRFEEEKRRGLTIDLGFAHTVLPDGEGVSFVDVPGHVRFLRNMLAGVGAVDACLFVVAATEGWKPQSEEHLRILELLASDTVWSPSPRSTSSTTSGVRSPSWRSPNAWRAPSSSTRRSCPSRRRRAWGSTLSGPRSSGWWRRARPPPIGAGRGCGWTVCSPLAAAAPS